MAAQGQFEFRLKSNRRVVFDINPSGTIRYAKSSNFSTKEIVQRRS